MYGEDLPRFYHDCIRRDFHDGNYPELLIVMGTTLDVEPVNSIVQFLTPQNVPRVLFNNQVWPQPQAQPFFPRQRPWF